MASGGGQNSLYHSRSYLAVTAIDFGTTYSGFAFSFNKGQEHVQDAIFMNRDWQNEQGGRTSKTPTCLLLNGDQSFHSFGYEALETYTSLLAAEESNEYLFFRNFKMTLHSSESLNVETTLEAANGRHIRAKTVFARSMQFLKDEVLKLICQESGDDGYNDEDIQWVLTVPAIWTPKAKQFMREAAYEAGIGSPENPEQLMIALEPEAAAVFCMEQKMSNFQSERGSRSVDGILSKPNSHHIVVDIGGGTLDVAVHEIQDNGTIKEIHKVTGGPYGGMQVNYQFERLLDELFGAGKLSDYRKSFPSDWQFLLNDFEGKKRLKRALEKADTRIRLPRSFVTSVTKPRNPAFDNYGPGEIKLYNSEYLCLSPKVMLSLFTPVVGCIKEHLRNLLTKPQLSKVKVMLLVGGFAECSFLQEEIKQEFSKRCKVMIPIYASITIVQGAVIFGKKPNKITARAVSTTYGAACTGDFIEGVHPEDKKIYADGIAKCNHLFYCFVKENEIVEVGKRVKTIYSPLRATDTKFTFTFYTAQSPNTQFITDPGMRRIGSVTLQSPDTRRGRDRALEVSMYFGGTEITATALDVSSGNTEQTTLNFVWH